jgi:hypothetical protein
VLGGHARELQLESDATDKICEARVGAKRIQTGIYPQVDKPDVVGAVGLFEPIEGLSVLAQASVN